MTRRVGAFVVILAAVAALTAPLVAPHPSDRQFGGLLNAPPTLVRVRDDAGRWRAPFIYPWKRVSQLEQRYEGIGAHVTTNAGEHIDNAFALREEGLKARGA